MRGSVGRKHGFESLTGDKSADAKCYIIVQILTFSCIKIQDLIIAINCAYRLGPATKPPYTALICRLMVSTL